MIGAPVPGGSLRVEGNGQIDGVEIGGRTGHNAPWSIAFGTGFEARGMGTCEGISSRVRYLHPKARKPPPITVKFRLAALAAELPTTTTLLTHWPVAD
jgi:hypothetical protein